jgi:hypothetical protein
VAGAPEPEPGDEWFLEQFWLLSTCRETGFSVGPVPATAVWALTDREGLSAALARALWVAVVAMDQAFLRHLNKKPGKPGK